MKAYTSNILLTFVFDLLPVSLILYYHMKNFKIIERTTVDKLQQERTDSIADDVSYAVSFALNPDTEGVILESEGHELMDNSNYAELEDSNFYNNNREMFGHLDPETRGSQR